MKIAFFSNYLNSHWTDFCDELFQELKQDFIFYSRYLKEEKTDSRGSKISYNDKPYVVTIVNSHITEEMKHVINVFDVVIVGSNNEDVYKERLKSGKLLIRLAERSFKNKDQHLKNLLRRIKYLILIGKHKNEHLFSLSSFCINDYRFTNAYKNRIYDFGYFPTFYELEKSTIARKKDLTFLWVGRFVSWKHPEIAIMVVKRLLELGFDPKLTMCGDGEKYNSISEMITGEGLENNVFLTGKRKQEEVRELMLRNKYFLFTSDSNEGWGAVLNEAMNDGCIAFASKFAGSTYFLIQNRENGYITDNSVDDIIDKIMASFNSDEIAIAENAYATIRDEWNGKNAANKFLKMIETYLKNGILVPFENGVLKKSKIIK